MTKKGLACLILALSLVVVKAFGCEDLLLENGSIIPPRLAANMLSAISISRMLVKKKS